MNIFKKFYNIDAPSEVSPAGPSIAAMAAKAGVLKQPGESGAMPSINNTEKKETPTTATVPPATATDTTPAEQAKTESPSPKVDPKTEQPQIATPEKVQTWQEVLKNQQPDTILKELGYGEKLVDFLKENKDLDPKVLGFVKHWKSNDGNVEPYLRALTTDFSKMSPEDVMKHQLQIQNPELDAKQLDRLYKLKVIDRYKLDSQLYSEEEVEDGRVELAVDVKPIRAQLSEQQQNYLFPKPEPKTEVPNNTAQQQQQESEAAFRAAFTNDPYIKDIVANKKITIGEGTDAFSHEVNADSIMKIMLDADTWANKMLTKQQNPDGSTQWVPNARKQALIGAILDDEEGFFRGLATHYKSLGGQAAIAPIENAKPPIAGEPAKAEVKEASPAAAAAKRGRLVGANS